MNISNADGPFNVTYEVNRFVLYMGSLNICLGQYYDKDRLMKDIKDHGLTDVLFHGLAVEKYLSPPRAKSN